MLVLSYATVSSILSLSLSPCPASVSIPQALPGAVSASPTDAAVPTPPIPHSTASLILTARFAPRFSPRQSLARTLTSHWPRLLRSPPRSRTDHSFARRTTGRHTCLLPPPRFLFQPRGYRRDVSHRCWPAVGAHSQPSRRSSPSLRLIPHVLR